MGRRGYPPEFRRKVVDLVEGLLPGGGGLGVRLLAPDATGHRQPGRSVTPGSPRSSATSMPPPARPTAAAGSTPSSPLGRGIGVGYQPWSCRLRRAGLQGVTGPPRSAAGCDLRRPPATWSSGGSPVPAVTSYG